MVMSLMKICWNHCIYKITKFQSLWVLLGPKALSQLRLLEKNESNLTWFFFLKGILNTICFSCCVLLYSSFTIWFGFIYQGCFWYMWERKKYLLFVKIIEEYYIKSIPSNMILQYHFIRIHRKGKLCKF